MFLDESGEEIASYSATREVKGWEGLYYGYYLGKFDHPKGVVPRSLREAMEDIKRQIDRENQRLVSAIADPGAKRDRSVVRGRAPGMTTRDSSGMLAVAVAELESRSLSAGDVAIVTSLFREALWKTGAFRVLERERVDRVIEELGFQMSGCSETKCAADIGRALNVEEMVVGTLEKLGDVYVMAVRFVNVETVQVTLAESTRCRCPIGELPSAVEELADKISRAMR